MRRFNVLNKYYLALELEPGSSTDEIKSAYNRLVKMYHPDSTQMNDKKLASDKFKIVHEARNVLLNLESPYKEVETPKEEPNTETREYTESVFKNYEDFKKFHEEKERKRKEDMRKKRQENRKNWEDQRDKGQNGQGNWSAKEEYEEKVEEIDYGIHYIFAILSVFFTGIYIYSLQPSKPSPTTPPFPVHAHIQRPVFLKPVPKERMAPRHLHYYYKGKKAPHHVFALLSAEDDNYSVFQCKTCNAVISKAYLEQHTTSSLQAKVKN